jgi:hypothetical protein
MLTLKAEEFCEALLSLGESLPSVSSSRFSDENEDSPARLPSPFTCNFS